MSGESITIITAGPEAPGSPMVKGALAQWAPADRPIADSITFEQALADETFLTRCGVAWVVLDNPKPTGLYSMMSLLHEHHIPAMLTRPGEIGPTGSADPDGAIIVPPDAPPAVACAVLRTLWAQAGVVRSLQTEIRALHLHQGGLCDQMGKIDEELRLAAQLQREFLPARLPRVGPVEFKVFFRPAGYVSGDIYDVIQLDEHHVGFFIADAVGHGVPAALMTMYIKRCLHTKTIDASAPGGYRIVRPDEALSMLNHDMVQHQAAGRVRFATACYGVLNCQTLALDFARAGHPYPLILRADGTTALLEADGGMLGIFPDEVYELQRAHLHPGDRLLVYSDGFEVAFPQTDSVTGKRQGMASARYAEEFKQLAHGPLGEALEKLVGRLDQEIGSLNQRDDLTVICLGVKPAACEDDDAAVQSADLATSI